MINSEEILCHFSADNLHSKRSTKHANTIVAHSLQLYFKKVNIFYTIYKHHIAHNLALNYVYEYKNFNMINDAHIFIRMDEVHATY